MQNSFCKGLWARRKADYVKNDDPKRPNVWSSSTYNSGEAATDSGTVVAVTNSDDRSRRGSF